jgi:hypothetical protein
VWTCWLRWRLLVDVEAPLEASDRRGEELECFKPLDVCFEGDAPVEASKLLQV